MTRKDTLLLGRVLDVQNMGRYQCEFTSLRDVIGVCVGRTAWQPQLGPHLARLETAGSCPADEATRSPNETVLNITGRASTTIRTRALTGTALSSSTCPMQEALTLPGILILLWRSNRVGHRLGSTAPWT